MFLFFCFGDLGPSGNNVRNRGGVCPRCNDTSRGSLFLATMPRDSGGDPPVNCRKFESTGPNPGVYIAKAGETWGTPHSWCGCWVGSGRAMQHFPPSSHHRAKSLIGKQGRNMTNSKTAKGRAIDRGYAVPADNASSVTPKSVYEKACEAADWSSPGPLSVANRRTRYLRLKLHPSST